MQIPENNPIPQNNPQTFQTGSLYVGDLEPNVTESVLFDTFRKVGPVASIRVCRDSSTRRSLGYSYVNYHRVEDAERALDTLNYTSIGEGKPCRIMWSQRDPSLRRSGQGNIYIKDLHPSIQSQDLYDNFSQFGTILSCKVETELDGRSKGFGYVHFENVEAAKKAIEGINGMEIEGKVVHVFEFQTKKQRLGGSQNIPRFTNIFVKNLNPKVTEKELTEKFSEYGKITSLVIMYDNNNVTKGFGFINYSSSEEAQRSVEKAHDTEFLGQKIYVAKAQKRSERLNELRKQFEQRKLKFQESNLYVKNLDDQIDDNKFFELFSKYGKIISAKVMKDENHYSKGFGFVCFSNPEEAQKAFNENGKMHFSKPLYVALAQRKEIRTAQLQAQYSHRQMQKTLPFNNHSFNNQRNPSNQSNNFYNNNNTNNNNNFSNNRHYQKTNKNQQYNNNFGGRKKQINRNNNNQFNNQETQKSKLFDDVHNAPEGSKKTIIGDFLYVKIEEFFRNGQSNFSDSGKITGMLLDSLDEQELLNLAEDNNELINKIEEAIQVLQEHQENQN
eukprot:TRINITY_DN442_c0_g1_i3.p1 TRINITY_DN442_c0_g1~~TRINITY_DN442_c0_g1_i3.p1  ORF type:complete len:557 (-),score=200.65 TRINITY_DN442_c0_g1_i3:89-1759(-)